MKENDNLKYYKIKITTDRERRTWLGWSNSSVDSGFYLTDDVICKIFSNESLERDPELIAYLKENKYELHPVEDITNIRNYRIYHDSII